MKTVSLMAGVVALTLVGAGCATKKYVAKTVSPVEARVTQTEGKNTDQDKQIAGHTTQIEEMDRDMSRTKEKLTDVDARATAAGQAAKQAGERADGAMNAANDARGAADKSMERANQVERDLNRNIEASNRYQMLKEESVQFAFAQSKLSKEAKAQLDEVAKTVDGKQRFVIEVQGFTDNVGTPTYNASLSEERARSVARYLTTEYKIPVRSISLLGVGSALPVGDEKTREGRKQNRRVDVRVYVPENQGGATPTPTASNR